MNSSCRKLQHYSGIWHPGSWRGRRSEQQPLYEDQQQLAEVLQQLEGCAPLVSEESICALKSELAALEQNHGWVLHVGDCAERFATSAAETRRRWEFLQSMAALWMDLLSGPVTLIGRIAGQFAKPRTRQWERTRGGDVLPVFRGDNIHSIRSTSAARQADPQRLLQGYRCAAEMMAIMEQAFAESSAVSPSLPYCYTSHEGLILPYEQSLTRSSEQKVGLYYNRSAHLLWLGERTRSLSGAHVEYFRGLHNPLAVKIGPRTTAAQLEGYLQLFNGDNEGGKLMFITRLGADCVEEVLPPLIAAVRRSAVAVIWSCDPMHGNSSLTPAGQKVRFMSRMIEEFEKTFKVHRRCGSELRALHLEITPEVVRECLGVGEELAVGERLEPYLSYCDPRLNAEQSVDFLLRAAEILGSAFDV